MPTICPNCLRVVRSGAHFCGFCGTNLIPPSTTDDAGVLAVELESAENELANETRAATPAASRNQVRRTILIIIIILLCLVLVTAFVVHYWSVIGHYVLPLSEYLKQHIAVFN
jgi:RNA polymerase subunit RPABC4/transcription elongation factor Spt4